MAGVRQLLNTLRSAAVWAEGDSISKEDIVSSTKSTKCSGFKRSIMNLDVAKGIVLDELITRLHKDIIEALEYTKNNKKQAAALLGSNSHQVLTKEWERRTFKSSMLFMVLTSLYHHGRPIIEQVPGIISTGMLRFMHSLLIFQEADALLP